MFFFVFLKEALVEERQKNKNNQGVFGFFMDSSYISSKHLTKKQKKLEFFCFFALLQLRFDISFQHSVLPENIIGQTKEFDDHSVHKKTW